MSAFFAELMHAGLYKRSQGRITRQLTFAAIALAMLFGAWRLHETLQGNGAGLTYGVPFLLLAVGLWAAYRLVNLPSFADFLIAVEAEMNKVSWPSRGELYRSCIVVLVVIFLLTSVLYFFDLFWNTIFRTLRIL